MSMPSYDGQLSGPARKAGYEIQSQAREMKTALSGDAESLRKTAQAFEDVDNQTTSSLLESLALLLESPLSPQGGKPRGSASLTSNDLGGPGDWGPPWDTSTTEIIDGPLGRKITRTIDEKTLPDGSIVRHITDTWTIIPTPEEIKAWSTNEKLCLIGLNLVLFFLLGNDPSFVAKVLGVISTVIADVFDLLNIQIPDLSKYLYFPEMDDTVKVTREVYVKYSPDGTRKEYERDIYHQEVFSSDGTLRNDTNNDTGWYEIEG
jgi:hypothetical protein